MIRLFVKIVFLALFVVCAIVVYLMYSKLSFIDWPYVIAGLFFLTLGLLLKRKKKKT
jgi:LPXTG-motif cell wall-anchored protein